MKHHSQQRFGPAFYRRFYRHSATRVTTRRETVRRAAMVAAMVDELDMSVRRILDMGCGLGWFKTPLLKHFSAATYTGVEYSEHLCARHGWQQGSAADYRGRGQFDLIVCQDMLQYLDDRAAARAIHNLARLCRGVLYVWAPTREDLQGTLDHATDAEVHLRSHGWYQQRLRRHFIHLGMGVHVRRGIPYALLAMQSL